MKCGIVTVYNSENCGSFLQAFALARALNMQGHDAVFVCQNFGEHSASRRSYFVKLAKTMLRGKYLAARQLVERRKNFRTAIERNLQVTEDVKAQDCFILGSDVIWDVTSRLFRNRHSFFWGTQFYPKKVISYAASIGFSREEDLKRQDFVQASLHFMSAVSVRDEMSQQLLQPYCDKEIFRVCDPTYLIDRADYDAIAKPTELEKFIFLYCYKDLPAEDQVAIQNIAAKEGLKTVTFGNFNKWCDISLAYDPLLFLSIYDKAEYIITDTFHGTVFATIYENRFAVVNNNKQKVLNVMKMCGLSDKMTNSAEDYTTILHSEFDYMTTRENIRRERANSLRYLCEAIEER